MAYGWRLPTLSTDTFPSDDTCCDSSTSSSETGCRSLATRMPLLSCFSQPGVSMSMTPRFWVMTPFFKDGDSRNAIRWIGRRGASVSHVLKVELPQMVGLVVARFSPGNFAPSSTWRSVQQVGNVGMNPGFSGVSASFPAHGTSKSRPEAVRWNVAPPPSGLHSLGAWLWLACSSWPCSRSA